jgi:hypothetical protein
MANRFDIYHQIMQLDPKEDCQEIVWLEGAYEYPWLIKKSLEFALFRTYGVPKSSQLLDKSGQFRRHGQRRYDDTSLLIAEITENGYESERGLKAIRIMNRLHGQYDISNEEMLYVLSTFIFEPIRWNQKYGWRTPSHHENLASYYFWVEVGKRMNIKDIPDSYEAYEQYNVDYERDNFAFDPANKRIADATIEVMQSWYPSFLSPMVRQVIYTMVDDRLGEAFGFPKGNALLGQGVELGLKAIAKVIRYMPPRNEPFRYTKAPNRSYPKGYDLEKLGPPTHHQPSKS